MSNINSIVSNHLFFQEIITVPQLPVGKHNHVPDSEFDPEQLRMGIDVEYEHTDNVEFAKAIAKDHLSECKTYYTRLAKMEKECEKDERK